MDFTKWKAIEIFVSGTGSLEMIALGQRPSEIPVSDHLIVSPLHEVGEILWFLRYCFSSHSHGFLLLCHSAEVGISRFSPRFHTTSGVRNQELTKTILTSQHLSPIQ